MTSPDGRTELPPGWTIVSLGEIVATSSGGTPSRKEKGNFGGGIPWLKIGDLNDGVVVRAEETLSEVGLANSSARLLPAGTLLVAMYGSIGKLGVLGMEAATNQAICALETDSESLRNYLYWYLRYRRPELQAAGFGGTQANISQTYLRGLLVPIPPEKEQDRIVEAIEEISALVDDADAALGATLRLIEAYVGRGLRDLFWAQDGRPRWETRPLGEICGTSSGGTPSRKERSHFGGDIPWIKIGDLNDGVVTKTEERLTAGGLESSSASLLPAGTLLIAMYGSIGRLGISGMEAATNQAICAFKPNSDVVLRDYLYWFLRASRRDLVRAGYGGAQPNLSQKYIRSIQVPLPSISEQANVVARARQTAEAATQTREAVKRVQEQATTLRRSLLHRAMTGQLVPQYSSDEPASELLSRIQAEKAELKQRIGTARKATSGHQQAA